jgi:hypothetical protein
MDDTKLFARDCADFFNKRLFTPNVKPEDLGLRIDAAIYLMAKHLQNGLPGAGTPIQDFIMGTKGGGGPHHLVQLVRYLQSRNLPQTFYNDMA